MDDVVGAEVAGWLETARRRSARARSLSVGVCSRGCEGGGGEFVAFCESRERWSSAE